MAVLFVVYIPIEDVSDPTEDDSQEKNKKIFEIEPAFNSVGDYGLPRVDSKQKFREVPSVTDIACAQQQQQQLQLQQQENNIKVLQGLPTATQQNEDIEYASESKPLLEITPKSVSPSKLPKSASSNVLMDRNQQQPQPQMTTTTTTTTLQSAENNNTLPKSFYREIPGSRFKVSIAAENPAKPASAAMTTSTNEVAKFPRRESTVPSDMFNDDSVEFIKEVITLKELQILIYSNLISIGITG
ncbi:hypothetical protein HELRODRAFT_160481 [Helobdella robusta]|uniref:Uncharacterized protein n=1 Tax=Helobdella robusta TaxID=6412 RepID=T1EQA9_HELRO|nr:hypothetical protein HELRODRAFT_160481 [Helobdella robusta]ESO06317.1 hypothetical protein HELRODRAFT_160481 [Helobdella robusta]